jgi:hypothetical protein
MKKRIEFFNEVKGVADLFPIIEAKNCKPDWIKKVREDYLQNKNVDSHLSRCPGIFELFNCGYIVRSWCDFKIKIPKDTTEKGTFHCDFPTHLNVGRPLVEGNFNNSMKFVPRPKGTLNNVFKVVTLWHIIAPKGLKFLFLPLPYPDNFEFYNLPGILDPGITTEINLQLFWNISSSHFIKAGTPLGQLIPLTEENYDFICRDMNTNDENWLRKFDFYKKHSFNKILHIRNKIKEMYEKHFNLN